MLMPNSLKWQKLLWSFVIIFAMTFYLYWRYSKSESILGFSIYPYLAWPMIIFGSAIVLILRIFRISRSKESFIYIFTGAINAFIGTIGTYLNFTSLQKIDYYVYLMFILNILLAIFIFWDAFVKEIPGIRTSRTNTDKR